jgi:glutathione S-transferase
MHLIGMLDSPYVRRVAVALVAADVPFVHRPISLFRHIDEFSKINPLLKAPTLVADDGTALMDSNLILDYLASVHPRIAALTPSTTPERLRHLRISGLALAVMEKAVQRHYERALRPENKRHKPWIARDWRDLTPSCPNPAGSAANSVSPTFPPPAPSASSEESFQTSSMRADTGIWRISATAPRRSRSFARRRPRTE